MNLRLKTPIIFAEHMSLGTGAMFYAFFAQVLFQEKPVWAVLKKNQKISKHRNSR